MTNLIKRKGLLSIMVIVVMVAMLSVACKNKATVSTSLSGEMPIDLTQDISQFVGKTFRSVDYLSQNISYLWVKISEDSTIKYQAYHNIEPDFKGGEIIVAQGMGQNYVFQGKNYDKQQSGKLIFEPDGTLTVKFISGTSYDGQTIECKAVDLIK